MIIEDFKICCRAEGRIVGNMNYVREFTREMFSKVLQCIYVYNKSIL